MFVLPVLIVPFVFLLAVYRLVQIPAHLMAGKLQVPAHRRALLSVASGAAYLLLLVSTLALSVALVHALFFAPDRTSALLSLLGYALAYPFAYLAAAWTFFYGLKPSAAARNSQP